MELFDYQPLHRQLNERGLESLAKQLDAMVAKGLDENRYGDIPRWRRAVEGLPDMPGSAMDATGDIVKLSSDVAADTNLLREQLMGLHPWRKGPFDFFGLFLDTEWRSDRKWRRLKDRILPLEGRRVLDVGCGSGYHCWRMRAEGAALVLGIDPTPLFIFQFWALQRYVQDDRVWVLPTRMEELPPRLAGFDSVFSMGVLYHRRSPIDHLLELRESLVDGGQLVLETLVIEGDAGDILVPEGRYSKMGNVWFIPAVAELCNWLRKIRFKDIDVVDVSVTDEAEQRSTEWMNFQSLKDFLDPIDKEKTIEGYPAPRRAIVTARK